MARPIHVEEHHTIEELEAREQQVQDVTQWRRVRAILLARKGLPTAEIYSQVGRRRAWWGVSRNRTHDVV